MSNQANRMPLIDALKGIAAQVILLHHLSAYGPLSQGLRELSPFVTDLLFDYGRIAVQIFLVIAGFLAARSLSPAGEALKHFPLPLLWKRYLRLSVPFLMAISIAIICAAIADHWLDDDMIPGRATFGQWLAHALLLHGLTGVESLSAGVWYVAIDFQLFALFALLLWVGRIRLVAPALTLLTGIGALFWFNRNPDLDNWAIYFFASYALGAAAWWTSNKRTPAFWLGLMTTFVIAGLMVDFRLRIAVALCTALLLGFARRTDLLSRWPDTDALTFLGQTSYSVFLIHFPVLLLANALFVQLEPETASGILAGLLLSWFACLAAGLAFYRWVEHPAAALRIQTRIIRVTRFALRPFLPASRHDR